MNPWQELGISETDDIREIKRAYARKLKSARPDEHPQEFQQLHAAYTQALKRAGSGVARRASKPVRRAPVTEATPAQQQSLDRQTNEKAPARHFQPPEITLNATFETGPASTAGEADGKRNPAPAPADRERKTVPPGSAEPPAPAQAAVVVEADAKSLERTYPPAVVESPPPVVSPETEFKPAVAAPAVEPHSKDVVAIEALPPVTPPQTESAPAAMEPDAERVESERLLAQVDRVLADDRRRGMLSSWRFLERTPYMLDDRFCKNLGFAIFVRIDRHYRESPKIYIRQNKSCPILNFLDGLFDWTGNPALLRANIGDRDCGLLLAMIEERQLIAQSHRAIQVLRGGKSVREVRRYQQLPIKHYYFGHPIMRMLAMAIDFAVVIQVFNGMCLLLEKFSGPALDASGPPGTYVLGALLLICSWLFECSRLQATPGMMLFGLKAMSRDFDRIAYWRGLLRHLPIVVATAYPQMIVFMLLLIVFIRNDGALGHDLISKTVVIDYRRSQKAARRALT